MLYEYARQMIAMFFLIAVVNLLVIPASYKKIITFYLHFFIIVIILKPLISIMNNEAFVNEDEFDQSIEYYQGLVENDLSKMTMTEIESLIRKAEDDCQVQLTDFELGEVLTVKMVETDAKQKTCLLHQLGLEQIDVIFERGG